MAYAALVSLQQTTDMILNHVKYCISVGEKAEITSISEYVSFLISFLENFPEKAHRLEMNIRDLANEAEDLIEEFLYKQFQMNWCSVGVSRVQYESRLNRVREEIGRITGDMMDDRPCDAHAPIPLSSVAAPGKTDVVVGLDEDLIAIKDRLCGESSKLEVIPIVGMGGIGKTTLARYAYDDPLVMEYFDIRVFVQASQDYSVNKTLSNLVASIKLFEEQMIGETKKCEIAERVYKGLKGRRYLIVMDDVWSTNVWDDVRNIFPNDNNGSRIVLTTRLSDVAAYASCSSPAHDMKFMDGNQTWKLLKQKVFTEGYDCPPELEDIGEDIARGCRGLPLAAVLVAGILSTVVKTKASWAEIGETVNSVVDGQLEKILSLSYTHLPHRLRPCFLFIGGFPEDYNISVSRLIKLWVGEGFLQCDNGCTSLEEEAEECLEDLVRRSLVLVTSRKSNEKIKSCTLHDMVRDMCITKAQEEKFLLIDRYVVLENRINERRVSIGHLSLNEVWSPNVHTILFFQAILDCSTLSILVRFRLLRVLDVMHCHHGGVLFPPQVFELFHLRYLALGFPIEIPAAISNLENLQTLIIRAQVSLGSYLPLEIWRMPKLRHLLFTESYMLLDPAEGSTLPLNNLQTLSNIASSACRENILKMIPNLKKMGITISGYEETHHGLRDLVNLHQLEKLKITTCWDFSWQGKYPAFPRTLIKLTLVGGQLPWKDMNIVGSLPNLQVLKLKDDACDGRTWETANGEFPELKFLLIKKSNLQHWITESDHFPRLKCLMLHDCPYLREIPDSIGEIPTLESIEVDKWNESLLNSAKQIQEDQQSYGNDVHVRGV